MSSQFIGRRVQVALGVETTPGTEVAPTDGFSQLKLGLQRKTTVIDNVSAMGRVEDINDSAIVEEWAEGPLEGKVRDITVGYLLYCLFGSVATTANADASTTIKDHTFNINQSQNPPTLTFVRKDPLTNRRHGLGSLSNLDITVDQGDYAKLSAGVKAKVGVTGTDTLSLVDENEFTSKHVVVKHATTVGGLAGATAPKLKSLKLAIARPNNLFFPFGQIDPSDVTTGTVSVTGEMVLQYEDVTRETIWFANTIQALSISLINTDVTIGTSARPGLVFTMPRVRFNSFNMSDDLDNVIEQTIGVKAEIDLTAGYMIRAVLTNTKTLYA